MKLHNPATGQTTDQPQKSLHVWADLGWLAVEEPTAEEIAAEEVAKRTAEETAEDKARGRHPAAKATKDK
jgi:hypothetical protein